MNCVVITGSPHRAGTTALLADEFVRGASEAGHEVFRFDAAFEKIAPCLGCNRCRSGRCVHEDAMDALNPRLLAAETVVFVTPLYYFGMSAQIKRVIDRFYANNEALREIPRRGILMAACHDAEDWAMEGLVAHYRAILRYLNWTDGGVVLAKACGTRGDVENLEYPAQAYRLGRKLAP